MKVERVVQTESAWSTLTENLPHFSKKIKVKLLHIRCKYMQAHIKHNDEAQLKKTQHRQTVRIILQTSR